jgi:hypothetical protein
MSRVPPDTSAEEPDGGNLQVRIWRGPGLGDRPRLLNSTRWRVRDKIDSAKNGRLEIIADNTGGEPVDASPTMTLICTNQVMLAAGEHRVDIQAASPHHPRASSR